MSLQGDSFFEKQTQCILLTFLKEKTFENHILEEEIYKLEKNVTEWPDDDDEDIQTDGHCESLSFFRSGQEIEEALCREIGVRLAQMGDGLNQGFNHDEVEGLIQAHEINQPQEARTITLSTIIDGLSDQGTTVIQDLPRERSVLLLTLWLLEKTVLEQPRLLPRIFRTTVQFITTRLQNYIHQLGGWENLH
ncbi:BH3-interacting domain death agonist-like [Rhinoraja longicauda]